MERQEEFYLLNLMRVHWENWGCQLLDVEGLGGWPEADGVFLHVDLSQLPSNYQKQAERYHFHWNAGALDICKRRVCGNLVEPGDGYDGPVVLKTNLNHAGLPENMQRRRLKQSRESSGWRRLLSLAGGSLGGKEEKQITKKDYRIYGHMREVPAEFLHNDAWVLQTYCVEPYGTEEHALREYYFLGEVEYLRMEKSPDPLFTSGELVEGRAGPVHPALRKLRQTLGLDYGKIDYVMRQGEPFIFDANKPLVWVREFRRVHKKQPVIWPPGCFQNGKICGFPVQSPGRQARWDNK
ncbi:MAG: hypothetical protein HC904_06920 [Blastochloris sp.]|nr:hypothetical protein [Blastochloris sp.]